jgi:hypothetical protein
VTYAVASFSFNLAGITSTYGVVFVFRFFRKLCNLVTAKNDFERPRLDLSPGSTLQEGDVLALCCVVQSSSMARQYFRNNKFLGACGEHYQDVHSLEFTCYGNELRSLVAQPNMSGCYHCTDSSLSSDPVYIRVNENSTFNSSKENYHKAKEKCNSRTTAIPTPIPTLPYQHRSSSREPESCTLWLMVTMLGLLLTFL